MCDRCLLAAKTMQEWVDKQGHDRCWYYPDLFRKLCEIYGIDANQNPALPSLGEFKKGCETYQQEEFRNEMLQSDTSDRGSDIKT